MHKQTFRQVESDLTEVTFTEFVPDKQEILEEASPFLQAGLASRDVCGDGTDEYRHNEPLVLWKQFPVLYYIDSSIITKLVPAVVESADEFNYHSNFEILRRTNNLNDAKIHVSMQHIDVPGRTLAQARWFYRTSTMEITRGTIIFDTNEAWSILENENCGSFGNIFDFGNVATHEFGHLFGLGHAPTDKLQTMYASTSPGKTLGRTLGNGDVLGFQKAYNIEQKPENKPPKVEPIGVLTEINTPVTVTLKGSDPDGDQIDFLITEVPNNGKIKLNDNLIDVTYTPNKDFLGTDSFKYTARDNKGAVAEQATVSIMVFRPDPPPINQKPIAKAQQIVTQDREFMISLQGHDPDNNLPLTFRIRQFPSKGRIIAMDNNKVTYKAKDDFPEGEDVFTFTVTDSKGLESDPAAVRITLVKPQPKTHQFTETELAQIKMLTIVYQNALKTGDQNIIDKTRENLQAYIIDRLIEKHI